MITFNQLTQKLNEASGDKAAYQKFFNSLLKKFGVSSQADLEGDKKKKFYDALDAGWEGDNEKPEDNELDEANVNDSTKLIETSFEKENKKMKTFKEIRNIKEAERTCSEECKSQHDRYMKASALNSPHAEGALKQYKSCMNRCSERK